MSELEKKIRFLKKAITVQKSRDHYVNLVVCLKHESYRIPDHKETNCDIYGEDCLTLSETYELDEVSTALRVLKWVKEESFC